MTRYWAEVFDQPSKLDDHTVQSVCETDESLAQCVTVEKVKTSLKGINDGAPGPDSVKKEDLQKVPLLELTAHMNLWLATGVPPDAFLEGDVTFVPKTKEPKDPGDMTFVPKTKEPKDPGDFRPITLGSKYLPRGLRGVGHS